MGLAIEVRVGKKRTIVIPKAIADALGIDGGSKLLLELRDDHIVLKPIPDAVILSIGGEKIARVTLEELEAISLEERKRGFGFIGLNIFDQVLYHWLHRIGQGFHCPVASSAFTRSM
jgi:AbrB family looped-hinge helix DNA binding protein